MRAEREVDDDERREAIDQRRARRRGSGCLCGWPDLPGRCPGAANCPMHGEDLGLERRD
jgi:hypothetical protein